MSASDFQVEPADKKTWISNCGEKVSGHYNLEWITDLMARCATAANSMSVDAYPSILMLLSRETAKSRA